MKLSQSVQNGFRFKCHQCGVCCSNMTDGYIFVYPPDIQKIKDFFKIPIQKIAEQYFKVIVWEYHVWDENLEDTGKIKLMRTLVLDSMSARDCLFLKKKGNQTLCEIYNARPFQCRSFPFWSMIMTDEDDYQDSKKFCQGFEDPSSDAVYFDPEQIQKYVYEERELERNFIEAMKKKNYNICKVYPFLKESSKFHCPKFK